MLLNINIESVDVSVRVVLRSQYARARCSLLKLGTCSRDVTVAQLVDRNCMMVCTCLYLSIERRWYTYQNRLVLAVLDQVPVPLPAPIYTGAVLLARLLLTNASI